MTHDECRNNLSAWLDGALTPEEAKAVSVHLVACHECSTVSDEMRSLSATLHALPRHEMPGDLKAIVLDATGAATSGAWMLRPWALASAAALASVLVVIGVVGLRRPEAPQIARLDESLPQDFGSASLDRERAPGESTSKESLNEPASPAPARRNQERFSPVPPAAPEDKPVSLDDLRKSTIGDEAKEKQRQDRNEAQEVAGITSLTSPVEQSTTAPPPAEEPSLLEASSLNYVARLIADGEGGWKLEPVEPPAVAGKKDAEADGDEAGGEARNREKSAAGVGATGPAAAGAPVMAREGERAPATTRDSAAEERKMEAGSPNRMVFLVQLDAGGNITSAQLVGARTTAPEIAQTARKLLIGTRYPGSPMGRFSHAMVEILAETPPPSR